MSEVSLRMSPANLEKYEDAYDVVTADDTLSTEMLLCLYGVHT